MIIFLIFTTIIVIYLLHIKKTEQEKYVEFNISSLSDGNIPIETDNNVSSTNNAINVKIQDNQVDVGRIIEWQGILPRKFEFRPQTFSQFIGQYEAKERAKTIIKKSQMNLKSHFLIDGIRGHGKTTFVYLIQKQLGGKLLEYIGRQINEDNIVDIINAINTSQEERVMLFVDEFDTMDYKVIKILNPILETFSLSGKKIKPFTFAGATINKHILLKNNPDTMDRIAFQIKFEKYNIEELMTILKQYHIQLYNDVIVGEDILTTIASNCKFNPRTSIALLEEYVVEKDIKKVLRNNHIIKDGLTNIDIKILEALSQVKRMGANSLAMRVGLSEREYLVEFESFLVEYDYINRVPNRIITAKGLDILRKIKDK